MSTATATDAAAAAPRKNGRKKLLVIVGAALLVLGLVGGGAVVYLKNRAAADAEAAEADDGNEATLVVKKAQKKDPKHAPTFVPLDPFTVNLADREAERYAQVSISLELDEPKTAEAIKVFMPVIRNNILMVLSHKTAGELLEREGKTRLAREIQRETSRALGVEVAPDAPESKAEAEPKAGEGKPRVKTPKVKPAPLPVAAVHFSNFIIQ